jgi:PEGA domain-containing protein
MLRVAVVAVATIAVGVALAGCTSSSAPNWLTPLKPLQFESEPPGADVTVAGAAGQTCKTPCAIALPLTNQSVSFAMNGYLPQTVPVEVHSFTDFAPNPVQVTLQTATPPKPVKPKPRKPAAGPKTAAKPVAPAPPAGAPATTPGPAPAQDNAFSPPPTSTQSLIDSRFPPPPPPPQPQPAR